MIADREKYEVQSTVTGDVAKMSIDPDAMAHIMGILTDLYSDTELAVIREYSTNALDAHREVGNKQPIEVTLPGPLSPLFMVRDFGVGLTVQDIHEIYSQYGASTKRGTNDQVGMLGVGCKSALTYTDQFTVTSVKDGTRIQVVVSRDEDGAGSMTVQDTTSTDEPNGTTIMVPASHHNGFEEKARLFFRYWEPGTVLINGKAPASFDGLKVTDKIYLCDDTRTDLIVMGGVPYPANIETNVQSYRHKTVAFVNIGDVRFAPSREALMDSKQTDATLERVEKEFAENIVGALQREIDAADSHNEALRLLAKWQNVLPSSVTGLTYTYRGQSIPQNYQAPPVPVEHLSGNVRVDEDGNPQTYHPDFIVAQASSYVMSRHSWHDKFPTTAIPDALFVVNYDRKTYTANVRKKLDLWLAENADYSPMQFVCIDHKPSDLTWFDESRIVEWADVNALKLPTPVRKNNGRIPGSYDMYLPSTDNPHLSYGIEANDIDTSYPVYYFSGDKYEVRRWAEAVTAGGYECTIVVMPSTRVAKFCRNFPNAKNVEDVLAERYTAWASKISKADLMAIAMEDEGARDELSVLDPDRLDDPTLAENVRWAQRDIESLLMERRAFRSLVDDALDTEWENPLEAYPLFSSYEFRVSSMSEQHTYLYMNAAYDAGKGA